MAILVTGATGLLGNNIVRLLLARGEDVRVLARNPDDRALAGLDVEKIEGDVRDPAAVRRAVEGMEGVVHAAAMVHIGWRGKEQWPINVEGTRNVVDACICRGARMAHISSVDALGIGARENPATEENAIPYQVEYPYGASKQAAEKIVLEGAARGLSAVILNPAYMLGPWDWKPSSGTMLLEVKAGRCRFAPSGGNDFCDARDVAAGVLAALERGRDGERYILSGEGLSYFEAWTLFAEIVGRPPPRGEASDWITVGLGRVGGVYGFLRGREGSVNSAAAAIACLPHHFSSAKAEAELGYRSRPVEESARDAWNWFQENGYRSYEPVRDLWRTLRGRPRQGISSAVLNSAAGAEELAKS